MLTHLVCGNDIIINRLSEIKTINFNNLPTLDLSNNLLLDSLDASNVNLTNLDLSKNTNLKTLNVILNPELQMVCIPSINDANKNFTKDKTTTWSENCNITDLTNEIISHSKVIKAYNLQGIEIPVDTKNELIILLYNNGQTKKVIQY